MDLQSSRRDLLLASFAALLPLGLGEASASPIDPNQTIIKLPGELAWRSNPANPARSVESCVLAGDPTAAGLYDGVIKGHPEPAIIAICGIGPINYRAVDPALPGVRAL
jgi:hypothetical protein